MRQFLYYVLSFLQLGAVLLFCGGFFPQKVVLKDDSFFNVQPEVQELSKPVFDRLVIIVIDALRSDFMFQEDASQFHFLHSLLNSGEAWGYTAYSNPPTVTLPRLKGITTGSAPNFLDAILNVAEDDTSSNLKEQDSLLNQFHNKGFKINFFGDDTWLKLFPTSFFNEYEGTNSFFVSDFEQVDLNVTRHLPYQLDHQDNWDLLILHYLGLDHIGHKGGSKSRFMAPKQREMDEVIKQIYESVGEETLMVVLGDHGMNDLGNHGGSSPGETSAAMSFISKKLVKVKPSKHENLKTLPIKEKHEEYKYLAEIQQIDLVPTLSMLFNMPIPKNSMGIVIKDFLPLLNQKLSEIKVQDNLVQLSKLKPKYNAVIEDKSVEDLLLEMKVIQEDLALSATNYNYTFLKYGIGSMILGLLVVLFFNIKPTAKFVFSLAISLVLGISMFASSFIEEEHQIWWWLTVSLILVSKAPTTRKIIMMTSLRLIRGWNNSGQKYIYESVINDLLKQHTTIQWILNIFTMLVIALPFLKNKGEFERLSSILLATFTTMSCLTYKSCFAIVNGETLPKHLHFFALKSCGLYLNIPEAYEDSVVKCLVPIARMFFKICAVAILFIFVMRFILKRGTNSLYKSLAIMKMILVMQTSSANIPMFLLFEIICYTSTISPLLSLCLQNLTFFQFGGTNSIATINLTNAYNGVNDDYNIYVVGILMFISNFSPAIYWSLSAIPLTTSDRFLHLQHYYITGLCLLIACMLLRYHLFIWSVFSPKLCYYTVWSGFEFVIGTFVTLLGHV